MDRTAGFATEVRKALSEIVENWHPDAAELVEVDNLSSLVKFTWGGQTVTYAVKIERKG